MMFIGKRLRYILSFTFVFSAYLSVPGAARAAKLQQVTNWGASGVPADVLMFAYVPDKPATNPPLVVVSHYCGGSAQAVFGQASGIASAADQYGFILILPSNANASGANGRCWDISSTKAQTREGGGDPQAIYQMVKYAITQYKVNPNRIYATGDSSGGMMTELLLALYPDVFKAGSAFAGVPAGCGNAFDGSGLCGRPAQTAQQWGDRVRAMYPGYTGRRPRVQLFHGDADSTITFKNQAEAIKEWTNVLGLSTAPTATEKGLTLGTHQATRETWKNTCGYVVLDAFTSLGGDHGPSDALFAAKYVLPFLGLDTQAAVNATVDPEIAQCGGDGGTDGGTTAPVDAGRTGGSVADGGMADANRTGGAIATGGLAATGGTTASGGTPSTGGSTLTGGNTTTGGSPSTGGSNTTGGSLSTGGNAGSGGVSRTGGSVVAGGNIATGGNSVATSGGASTTGGNSRTGGTVPTPSTSSGCSYSPWPASPNRFIHFLLVFGLALTIRGLTRRNRRPTATRN